MCEGDQRSVMTAESLEHILNLHRNIFKQY